MERPCAWLSLPPLAPLALLPLSFPIPSRAPDSVSSFSPVSFVVPLVSLPLYPLLFHLPVLLPPSRYSFPPLSFLITLVPSCPCFPPVVTLLFVHSNLPRAATPLLVTPSSGCSSFPILSFLIPPAPPLPSSRYPFTGPSYGHLASTPCSRCSFCQGKAADAGLLQVTDPSHSRHKSPQHFPPRPPPCRSTNIISWLL